MLFYTHPTFFLHDVGEGHPENPGRLVAIQARLEQAIGLELEWREAPASSEAQLQRVHGAAHVSRLLALRDTLHLVNLDADTVVMRSSVTAALHAAGAAVAAVEAVTRGEAKRAFCAVRPPGHHAEPEQAMGFCLFNNVAVGAAQALTLPGIARVAIIDFDVHHGNGTQAWAEQEPRVLFCSVHQMPLYPGSGLAEETGPHDNCLNIPLLAGSGRVALQAAWSRIEQRLERFQPELLMVSAGFDGHTDDPLGGLQLTAADYDWISSEIVGCAERLCGGRVVSCLEGGYNHEALADCVEAHLRVLAALPL